mgnify:FL=1
MDAWLRLASIWDIIHLAFFRGISKFNQAYMLDRVCLHDLMSKFQCVIVGWSLEWKSNALVSFEFLYHHQVVHHIFSLWFLASEIL